MFNQNKKLSEILRITSLTTACNVLLFMVGSACMTTTDMRSLQEIPTMNASFLKDIHYSGKNYLDRRDIGIHFSMQKSANWVPIKVPTDLDIFILDGKYREVDYYHFLAFNNWYKKLIHKTGLYSGQDRSRANDCDNFAMLYKSLLGISAYKSGDNIDLAVAVVVVRQKNKFGGIPASDSLHMVNLVFTTRGWFIYEPQTNAFVKLENYPNQEFVRYMIL